MATASTTALSTRGRTLRNAALDIVTELAVSRAVCMRWVTRRPRRTRAAVPRVPSGATIMADIVLVNPRFEVSYWGLEHALPLLGKKCNLPTACLRATRANRHDQCAGAPLRPAQDQELSLRQHSVQPRMSVPVRILRHHRHIRTQAAAEDER